MDCLEYRRLTIAEPEAREPERHAHRLACRACADWAARGRRFDERLADALAVPVPDGLAERVAMRAAWSAPRRRWLAIAAGVAATTAGALLALQLVSQPALADIALDHVYHEPDLLLPGDGVVEQARLDAVLARVGARVDGGLGRVMHAGLCPVGGVLAAHLVVAGEHGPIAVLVVPRSAEARRFDDGTLAGRVIPVSGGAVAVVGARGEPLAALAERVRTAVTVGG